MEKIGVTAIMVSRKTRLKTGVDLRRVGTDCLERIKMADVKKVLIAHDDEASAEMLMLTLEVALAQQVRVMLATSLDEARSLLLAELPEVAFLDLDLSVAGTSWLDDLSGKLSERCKIIVFSQREELKEQFIKSGAFLFLKKPECTKTITEAIISCLNLNVPA